VRFSYFHTRLARRCSYYWSGWPRSWLIKPFKVAQGKCLRATVQTSHHGIQISHLTESDPAVFVRATVACLDLIQQRSPLHFHRIQRHVSFIADVPIVSLGKYDPCLQSVELDFAQKWLPEQEDLSLRLYAMTLVHEATHGYLCARFIPYTKQTRSRVEQICVNEENRFVKHLGDEWSHLHRTFAEDDWRVSWHASRMKLIKLHLERARREFF
jgi:hypothetical protein